MCGDINYKTALQLLTYPVGTDVYTEIELFRRERGQHITVLYNDEDNPPRMLKRLADEPDVYTAVWNGGKQTNMLHYRVEEHIPLQAVPLQEHIPLRQAQDLWVYTLEPDGSYTAPSCSCL